ncbi:hypothetical protein ACFVZH_33420 [Streptomyces sp. NPDC059534]|uniref:hypothetical protein n=1 Tax=Streptomyces sp. NPDC059534 TaxID=3346859 RepID=UPI0036CD26CE
MKPRVVCARWGDRWLYVAECPCGWHYESFHVDWEFIVTIATAHGWLTEHEPAGVGQVPGARPGLTRP